MDKGKKVLDRKNADGTSTTVIGFDGNEMAEKGKQLLHFLFDLAQGPAEALGLMELVADFIRKEHGIIHNDILPGPPQ